MQYSVLIATIFAAFIAVASAGRFFKRPLMEGHNWKMPKTMGENARVHVDDVHNFHELEVLSSKPVLQKCEQRSQQRRS